MNESMLSLSNNATSSYLGIFKILIVTVLVYFYILATRAELHLKKLWTVGWRLVVLHIHFDQP